MTREREENENFRFLEVNGERRLVTINLSPNIQVYGERLLIRNGVEYRVWDPFRSKLAASILSGVKNIPFKKGSYVLYLGVSTGTTVSHISDIVGNEGIIYGVELAQRVAREFIDRVTKHRKNVIPILENARSPENYIPQVEEVDIVYSDIAQSDQTEIAIANCVRYLKRNGSLFLVVKSRSIDVTASPKSVFREQIKKLNNNGFKIIEMVELRPFDRDHAIIYATYMNG